MTRIVWIITHADVVIDPEVTVTDWGLNPRGMARHTALAATWHRERPAPDAVWSSTERKATDGAALLAQDFDLTPQTDPDLGENDRSATGFLPEPEFSQTATRFFENPDDSIRGWETSRHAQGRIVAAVDRVVAATPGDGDIAIVTHGGVSTLLMCALRDHPIDESLGPGIAGGGGIFAFQDKAVLRGWRAIEAEDALRL